MSGFLAVYIVVKLMLGWNRKFSFSENTKLCWEYYRKVYDHKM